MGVYTENNPKCMVEIGDDETIVSRQLRILKKAGINEVVMTTGPFRKKLEKYVIENAHGMNVHFVDNTDYKSTNYIYSMFLAKDFLDDDIILMHGDLVFEDSVLYDVVKSDVSCMTVSDSVPLPEKDFKAVIVDGKITAVGIEFTSNCITAQPIYHLKRKDFAMWMKQIERFCKEGTVSCYAENALNQIADQMEIFPLNYKLRLCQEIDKEEDLIDVKRKLSRL